MAWVDETVFYPQGSNTIDADHVTLTCPTMDGDHTTVPVSAGVSYLPGNARAWVNTGPSPAVYNDTTGLWTVTFAISVNTAPQDTTLYFWMLCGGAQPTVQAG